MKEFEQKLNRALTETFDSVMRYEVETLKTTAGVTVAEAHILEAIGDAADGTTVSELASRLGLALPTVTVAVKKLETKGYVVKTASADDGRVTMIGLTEAGKRVYKAHGLFHRRMVRHISAIFTEAEKDALLSAVDKLRDFFADKTPR